MIEINEKGIIKFMEELRKISAPTIDFSNDGLVIELRVPNVDLKFLALVKLPWKMMSINPIEGKSELACRIMALYSEMTSGKSLIERVDNAIKMGTKFRIGIPIESCPVCDEPGEIRTSASGTSNVAAYVYHKPTDQEPLHQHGIIEYLVKIGKTAQWIDSAIEHKFRKVHTEVGTSPQANISFIENEEQEESEEIKPAQVLKDMA